MLADRRLELVDINSDVHSHVTSGGQSSLKEDVATLYRIWDEVNHRSVRSAFIRRTIPQTGKMGRYGSLSYIPIFNMKLWPIFTAAALWYRAPLLHSVVYERHSW